MKKGKKFLIVSMAAAMTYMSLAGCGSDKISDDVQGDTNVSVESENKTDDSKDKAESQSNDSKDETGSQSENNMEQESTEIPYVNKGETVVIDGIECTYYGCDFYSYDIDSLNDGIKTIGVAFKCKNTSEKIKMTLDFDVIYKGERINASLYSKSCLPNARWRDGNIYADSYNQGIIYFDIPADADVYSEDFQIIASEYAGYEPDAYLVFSEGIELPDPVYDSTPVPNALGIGDTFSNRDFDTKLLGCEVVSEDEVTTKVIGEDSIYVKCTLEITNNITDYDYSEILSCGYFDGMADRKFVRNTSMSVGEDHSNICIANGESDIIEVVYAVPKNAKTLTIYSNWNDVDAFSIDLDSIK